MRGSRRTTAAPGGTVSFDICRLRSPPLPAGLLLLSSWRSRFFDREDGWRLPFWIELLFYAAIADVSASDLNAGRQIGKGLFLLIATVALIEVCLITPALTAGGIAGEKEHQTYDLLVSSLLAFLEAPECQPECW